MRTIFGDSDTMTLTLDEKDFLLVLQALHCAYVDAEESYRAALSDGARQRLAPAVEEYLPITNKVGAMVGLSPISDCRHSRDLNSQD